MKNPSPRPLPEAERGSRQFFLPLSASGRGRGGGVSKPARLYGIERRFPMLWGWFDPMYLLFLAPAMVLALWAQVRVQSAFATASNIPARSGLTGAQAAEAVLHKAGVQGVQIEPTEGLLSDHY